MVPTSLVKDLALRSRQQLSPGQSMSQAGEGGGGRGGGQASGGRRREGEGQGSGALPRAANRAWEVSSQSSEQSMGSIFPEQRTEHGKSSQSSEQSMGVSSQSSEQTMAGLFPEQRTDHGRYLPRAADRPWEVI